MKKSNVFSHFVMTRFNCGIYDREDAQEWMDHRMELFKDCKESVLGQKEHFKWLIAVDPRTPADVLKEIFTSKRMIVFETIVPPSIKFAFKEMHVWNEVDTPWLITSRLDNDDQYLPGAIRTIQEAFSPQTGIVDIPYQQLYGEKRYPSKRDLPNSPFLSLIEPKTLAIKTCYARPHNRMAENYQNQRFVDLKMDKKGNPQPLALMVIHDRNETNHLLSEPEDFIK